MPAIVHRQARTPGRDEKAPGSTTRSPVSGSPETPITPSPSHPARTNSARVAERARAETWPKRPASTATRSPPR
jgi:hypothetical protein